MRTLLIAAAAIAAATPGAATQRDPVPPAVEDGKPVNCLPLSHVRRTEIHGDSVIDFHTTGGKVYRNTLPYACPGLGFEERYAHKTSINQICSMDTITVLQSGGGIPGPSCGLGKFQPVKLVKPVRH